MASILSTERDPQRFPLIISQDGDDAPTARLIEEQYRKPGLAFAIKHAHESNAEAVARTYGGNNHLGYVYIAQHYGFAARTVFDNFGFQQVIFLEEDMEISPDFFSYFGAMLPILRADPDLFCVSAWNDNGERDLVADSRAVFRTDFFPGLGWMMNRDLWDEVGSHFPNAYWDEFMRRQDVRRGRHCIRPEVSRSFTFGSQGTSSGMFYGQHLSKILLNKDVVDWASEDLAYLASVDAFDNHLRRLVQGAQLVSLNQVDSHDHRGVTLKVHYSDSSYEAVAKKFGLMADEKEGIRRMSYRGVIPFAWRRNRIYLFTQTWPR
jgi:alpha-1,3-mannosyl-glycoprotein beta-1,2-N-acetylglucosaminyltransferase